MRGLVGLHLRHDGPRGMVGGGQALEVALQVASTWRSVSTTNPRLVRSPSRPATRPRAKAPAYQSGLSSDGRSPSSSRRSRVQARWSVSSRAACSKCVRSAGSRGGHRLGGVKRLGADLARRGSPASARPRGGAPGRQVECVGRHDRAWAAAAASKRGFGAPRRRLPAGGPWIEFRPTPSRPGSQALSAIGPQRKPGCCAVPLCRWPCCPRATKRLAGRLNPLLHESRSGAIAPTFQKEVGPGIRREHMSACMR
jgi:hypothetical protein